MTTRASNVPFLRLALAAATALALPVAFARAAPAAEPKIYLTWHAPWGRPGATDTLSAVCDTTRADTLWLSFEPGKVSPTFLGFNGTVLFHPPAGDSLPAWWQRDLGKPTPPQISVAFPPHPEIKYPQPFRSQGAGGTAWDTLKAQGRLRFIYAIPSVAAAPIVRGVFVVARIVVRRPPAGEPGCAQPMCIEWSQAEITFDFGLNRALVRSGPRCFVSLNSPGGTVAVPYREAVRVRSWQPKTQ